MRLSLYPTLSALPAVRRLRGEGGAAPDVTGPVVTDVVYTPGAGPLDDDLLSFSVNEDCILRGTHNASATPLTAAAIEAADELGAQAIAAGMAYVNHDDAAWAVGTWYLHYSVTDLSGNVTLLTPIEHEVAATFVSNAVNLNGTDTWLSAAALSSPVASKKGTFAIGFRRSGTWPAGAENFLAFSKTDGAYRVRLRAGVNRRVSFDLYDDAGGGNAYFYMADNTVTLDEWMSVVITWDSAVPEFKARVATGAGAFVSPGSATGPSITLDTIFGATPVAVVGARLLGGTAKFAGGYDLAYLYYAPGVVADIADSAVVAKFRASNPAGRGEDGSGPTGTIPLIYLSGETATFQENKGTDVDFVENGTLTTAASPLP